MKESLQDFGLPVPWAAASAATHASQKHSQKLSSVAAAALSRSDPPSYVSMNSASIAPISAADVNAAIMAPVGSAGADSHPKSALSNSSSTNTLVGAGNGPKVSVVMPLNQSGGLSTNLPSGAQAANTSLNSAANILPSSQPSTAQGTFVRKCVCCPGDRLNLMTGFCMGLRFI